MGLLLQLHMLLVASFTPVPPYHHHRAPSQTAAAPTPATSAALESVDVVAVKEVISSVIQQQHKVGAGWSGCVSGMGCSAGGCVTSFVIQQQQKVRITQDGQVLGFGRKKQHRLGSGCGGVRHGLGKDQGGKAPAAEWPAKRDAGDCIVGRQCAQRGFICGSVSLVCRCSVGYGMVAPPPALCVVESPSHTACCPWLYYKAHVQCSKVVRLLLFVCCPCRRPRPRTRSRQ